ncbi:MAG TPA: sugar nucleotide-binding protein, partial [Abditibacteriaceae bacterium]
MTTARFSGLYGHWYPHGRDALTFARALAGQCRAVALAMQAVREFNPQAKLIQTDDLGKTHSTPKLAYQAEFENERRWLSYDLLCGRVNNRHAMRQHLKDAGLPESEIDWFRSNPCPPDVIGINHYLTSERFLDHRTNRYPREFHGGNGHHKYADVPAVRVCAEGLAGTRTILQEVWQRYGLPVAITEAHLGCTREEQMRWLLDVWDAAQDVRSGGADIRAVTAWSLLGAYDWDSLVTRGDGHYEPGVFDMRGGTPRPTALAGVLKDIAAGRKTEHPACEVPGWWRRTERLHFPPVMPGKNGMKDLGRSACAQLPTRDSFEVSGVPDAQMRPLMLIHDGSSESRAFKELCDLRGLYYLFTSVDELETDNLVRLLEEWKVWAVVHSVQRPHDDFVQRLEKIAKACVQRDVPLLFCSSSDVFGDANVSSTETDNRTPRTDRGEILAAAEERLLQVMPSALIVRSGLIFDEWQQHGVVIDELLALARGESVMADCTPVTASYLTDAVNAALDLLIDGESGIRHLVNAGETSRFDLVRTAAECA